MKWLKKSGPAFWLVIIIGGVISCSKENTGLSLNGTWHMEEHSQLYGLEHYDVQITQIDTTQIEITNFYNLGTDTYVTASLSELSLIIKKQNVSGYIIQGTGSINSDYKTISFNFTANDGTVKDVVVAQCKR